MDTNSKQLLFDSTITVILHEEKFTLFLRDIKECEEIEVFAVVGVLDCDTNEHIFRLSRKKARALKKIVEAAIAKCLNKKKVVVFYDPKFK